MGGSVGKRGGKKGFRDINITPLVDVMLVLLVVFMVTAPILTAGLHIDLPQVNASETDVKDARLLVTVTKEGKTIFGEQDITGRVEDVLLHHKRVQAEKELFIRADKKAMYGDVAIVVGAARAAGVVSLNLLVEPDSEEVPDSP